MALYLRGKIWHYVFKLRGKEYRGSTLQSNKNRAKIVESKVRADAADALFGIGPAKASPFFRDFIENTFLPYVRVKHQARPNTVRFYEYRCTTLLGFQPFADARLNEIDSDLIIKFIDSRLSTEKQSRGEGKVGLGTVNHELTTLRVALKYAKNRKPPLISDAPSISRIKGSQGVRTFVVSGELETAYLAAAPYPLRHAAILMIDLGLRPAEVVGLRKNDISGDGIRVQISKTMAGIRVVPQTVRSKDTFDEMFALWPESPWVFPGLVKGCHYSSKALDALHEKLRTAKGWPEEFVLYSFRHTFGTRLAESGASMDDIRKLMGHTSITTSARYVHTGEEHLSLAMKRLEIYSAILRGKSHSDTAEVRH